MKSYTDIEQSRKLDEILPVDSADSHYVRKNRDFRGEHVESEWSYPKYGNPNSKHANYIVQNFSSYEKLPCWSLAALLGILSFPALRYDIEDGEGGWIVSCEKNDKMYLSYYRDNPVDTCYEMILKLKENGLL